MHLQRFVFDLALELKHSRLPNLALQLSTYSRHINLQDSYIQINTEDLFHLHFFVNSFFYLFLNIYLVCGHLKSLNFIFRVHNYLLVNIFLQGLKNEIHKHKCPRNIMLSQCIYTKRLARLN